MWTENLSVHELVEWSTVESNDQAEREIEEDMRVKLLSNDQTAKLTYSVSANEMKDMFTITLWNLSGVKSELRIEGTQDSLMEVNRYILLAATWEHHGDSINPNSMPFEDSAWIAILQNDIHEILSKLK